MTTPFAIFLAFALLWLIILKPMALRIIVSEMPRVNAVQDAVHVEVGKVDISLMRLQLLAEDVKITVRDLQSPVAPINIRYASAQLDLFDLLVGQLNIAKISIDGMMVKIKLTASKSDTPLPQIPIEKIFSITKQIPADHLIISNSDIEIEQATEFKSHFVLEKLSVSNLENALYLKIQSMKGVARTPNENSLETLLTLEGVMTPEQIALKYFSLSLANSRLIVQGSLKNYADLLTRPEGTVEIDGQINLRDMRNAFLVLSPQKKRLPTISGEINLKGQVSLNGLQNVNGEVTVKTSQVVLDHFKLGQADLKTSITKNQILINEINLEHPAGRMKLSNIRIEQMPPYHFNSKLEVTAVDAQKLFNSLNLAEIPVNLQVTGTANCEGLLDPSPLVNCSVQASADDTWVKAGLKADQYLIKYKHSRFNGDVKLTSEKFSFSTAIELGPSSTGSASGEVVFTQGFNVKFETNNLNFEDIETLAGMDLKGTAKIIGTTHGDSDHGLIDGQISVSNGEIDQFRVGSFSTAMNYKDAELHFTDFDGLAGRSNLKGQMHFNFKQSAVTGDMKSDDFRAEDLMNILNKKFTLPFELNGLGRMSAKFEGPFDFWKLRYNVDALFKNGSLAGERYDSLQAQLMADGNQIVFRNVNLKKMKSNVIVDGNIDTRPKAPVFNLRIKANPLQLEEADHIVQYAPSIAGSGFAEGTMTGTLDLPELLLNLTLKQVSYDKVEYPNSQGVLKIDRKYLSYNGQFFGRQIQTDIQWPWNENDNFYAKVLVQDLNPLFLLPLVSIPQPSSDYDSRMSAEIDLYSKTRSLAKAEGLIKLTDFVLQRGNQSLKLSQPTRLVFKSGLNSMEPIQLTGGDSYVTVQMDKSAANRIKLDIDGDIQLKLLHFLAPFAQNLSGELSINSQLVFKDDSFELLGEGELTDGLVSLKGLPQPIENINTPIEFSRSKIVLGDITGKFGTSDVSGVGYIDLQGTQGVAINLRAIADNVQLTFPAQVYTEGKATILFAGIGLPYNLKIDYKVDHGLVENNFEPDPKQSQTLKASAFLPQQQQQLLKPSMTLDVNVDLTNGILIKNKLLEGEAKGFLQVQGTPELPIIIGKISVVPGSKLIFKDKPFEIQNAVVQFQGTREINPDIYIAASARISEYDINLLVQGLAKSLTITPTSQPPLSQNDIFTLLALGVTNQGTQNLSSETQQKQTGLEVLAVISNQSQLNKRIQEKLGLTLQLAPEVDSTKNIAVPKVVVSKQLSKKVNASYAKPFTGNDQNQEVKLQYLYNNNVSVQLNYQNKDAALQEQITNSPTVNKSIFGLDLEFRDEFK